MDLRMDTGDFAALALCTEGQCTVCKEWAPIVSKLNGRITGMVQIARHRGVEGGPLCYGTNGRNLRNSVHVPPFAPVFERTQMRAAMAEMTARLANITVDPATHEGECPVCLVWVALERKLPPNDPDAPWVIQDHGASPASMRAKCVGRLTLQTRLKYTNGPATMAATPIKEDTRVDTQTNELRIRLRAARAERELKIKTDNADAIVTRLDSLPAGSIVRFTKPFAATGGKPAGEYTYVAIKPVDGARWYTTGCDANPMNSDDLASFMVGGESVTSWDVLGDASETFQVPDVVANDTPAKTGMDAGRLLPSAAEFLDARK